MKNSLRKTSLSIIWIFANVLTVLGQYQLDQSFGEDGGVVDYPGNIEVVNSIPTYDGKQYIISQTGEALDFPFIIRVDSDGQLDQSFHDDGAVIQWLKNDRRIVDLAVVASLSFGDDEPNESFTVLYQGNPGTDLANDLLVEKFLPDGSSDFEWGSLGLTQITPPDSDIYTYEYHSINAHLFGVDFIVTGVRRSPQSCDEVFAFAFEEDGSLETDFGNNGFTILDLNTPAGGSYPNCAYSIEGVNEKGGTVVAALKNSLGESSICIARADPNGAIISFTSSIEPSIEHEVLNNIVYVDLPAMFEGRSHNLIEATEFFSWSIPVLDETPAMLVFELAGNQEFELRKIDLALPEDAEYYDWTSQYEAGNVIYHFCGQKESELFIASTTLCEDEVTVFSSNDFGSNQEQGIFVSQQTLGPNTQYSLLVVTQDLSEDPTHSLKRIFSELSCFPTSVEVVEPLANAYSIYPNPVSGQKINLALNIEGSNDVAVSLVNLNGQSSELLGVFHEQSGPLSETLTLPDNLIPGIYLMKVEAGNYLFTEKLIVL